MNPLQHLESIHSGSIPILAEYDDVCLVQASQQGDQAAFALLVQRHQRGIFNLALHLLHDDDEANDITQEVFLAAWRGLPAFRNEARFSSWLYRIAYNESLQQVERQKREHLTKMALQTERFLEEASSEQRVEEAEAQHDRQALVREYLERLPAKYRDVLILRHLHDRTYEEMAEILALPIGTIKTHLFRARHLLKQRVQALTRENERV